MNEDELISTIRAGRSLADGPGGTVATVRAGVQRVASAGLADVENAAPIDGRTTFHVASVAKQFTGYLVAKLAAEGRLDLEAPIGDFLDWLSPPTSTCTIRQLLLHTAGLRDHWALSEFAGLRDGDSITTEDACGWISAQSELNFAPGSRFLYSNSGYVLLARMVEGIEEAPFADVARRRIFDPLGMVDTFFVDRPDMAIPGRARGYAPDGEGWVRSDPNYGVAGATCLRTTSTDMLAWLARPTTDAFFVDAASVGYFQPGSLDDGSPIRYGFGLIHTVLGGRPVILHGGFDYGFNAITIRDPDNGDAIFAASNGSTSAIEGAAMTWLAGWRSVEDTHVTGTVSPPRDAPVDAGRPLPGTYAREDMTDVRVVSDTDGGLKLFWMQELDLEANDAGAWSVVGTPVTAQVADDALTFSNGLDSVRLVRMPDEPFTLAEIDGVYVSDALRSLLRIETAGARTTMQIGRGSVHELRSINPGLVLFGSSWMTIERIEGKVSRLRLFQTRCASVPFRPMVV